MLAIFSGTQVGLKNPAQSLSGFINGLHTVFWVMAALMVLACLLSVMRAGRTGDPEVKPSRVAQ
jgi:hypothetical protein